MEEQTRKAMESTQGLLGIRVVGARMPPPHGEAGADVLEGSKYGLEPGNENAMRVFLRRFLRTEALLLQVLPLGARGVGVNVTGLYSTIVVRYSTIGVS